MAEDFETYLAGIPFYQSTVRVYVISASKFKTAPIEDNDDDDEDYEPPEGLNQPSTSGIKQPQTSKEMREPPPTIPYMKSNLV